MGQCAGLWVSVQDCGSVYRTVCGCVQEWARLEEQDKAQRFERLKHLLQRSNMYTEYLIERMKRQQAEEARRRERRAKKLARQEEKKREEEQKACEKEEVGAALGGGHGMLPPMCWWCFLDPLGPL